MTLPMAKSLRNVSEISKADSLTWANDSDLSDDNADEIKTSF